MKNKCVSFFLSLSVWIFGLFGPGASAMAEYKVVTETTVTGTSGVKHPYTLKPSKKESQACQLIADNINVMDKYNVDWSCDFPISDTIPLIRKPSWQQVDSEVMTKSRSYFDKKWKRPTLPLQEGVNGFFFPYDLSPNHEGEGIFMMAGGGCTLGGYQSTWYGKEDGSPFPLMPYRSRLNRMILVNNSLYLITYYRGSFRPKTFGVAVINKRRLGTDLICNIEQSNPDMENQE